MSDKSYVTNLSALVNFGHIKKLKLCPAESQTRSLCYFRDSPRLHCNLDSSAGFNRYGKRVMRKWG